MRSEIDWRRLDRFVAGDGSPEELEASRRWVQTDPQLVAIVEILRTAQEPPDGAAVAFDAREAWNKVVLRLGLGPSLSEPAAIGSRANHRPNHPIAKRAGKGRSDRTSQPAFALTLPRRRFLPRIAALVAVAASMGVAVYWRHDRSVPGVASPSDTLAAREYVARRGERLALRLSDGTGVTLAPESRLRVEGQYLHGPRNVSLVGQAHFEVQHDSTRPFTVTTDRFVASDLGTRFIVRAYGGEENRDVVVVEGAIVVHRGRDSLLLHRGDRGFVTHVGQLSRSGGVDVDRYVAWLDGTLVFRQTPLTRVLIELNRWYDIDVRLADSTIDEELVTASFRGESAREAVDIIASTAGLAVERNGSQYVLRRKT